MVPLPMPKRQRRNEPTAVPHEYERDDDEAAPADSMRPENAGAAPAETRLEENAGAAMAGTRRHEKADAAWAENWRWASWEQAEAVPDAAAERPWRGSESHASSSAAPATAAIPPDRMKRLPTWSAEEA